ncbi:MAG: OmpA family protein [Lachnospiraceae bacterium]|nr:OmpA family protein [Lachnospiraceae bacterium]
MARKKEPEVPKGSPAWMATFSDLMNLLLCFFVLLFSMSSVDAEKYEMVVQSLQQSFSVLPAGGTTISTQEGSLISSGVSALQQFNSFFNASSGKHGDKDNKQNGGQADADNDGTTGNVAGTTGTSRSLVDGDKESTYKGGSGKTDEELTEEFEKKGAAQSEKMEEDITEAMEKSGIQNLVDIKSNGQYVEITMNGAVLFASGKYDHKKDAEPFLKKLSAILNGYSENTILIEGHTDNVPMHTAKIESNDVLSMYRALDIANFVKANTNLDPSHVIYSGRGEWDPIAPNDTAENRALNRRVVVKIYNDMNSNLDNTTN